MRVQLDVIDVLGELAGHNAVAVNLSVTSLDPKVAAALAESLFELRPATVLSVAPWLCCSPMSA